MPSNHRYPNQTGSPLLSCRRVSFGLMTSQSAGIDAIVFDDFLGVADTWSANYAPAAPPTQTVDRLGDYGFPNQISDYLSAERRTRMRPDAEDGLDKIITRDFLGAQDLFGTASGTQAAQAGNGTGTVSAPAVPVAIPPATPEHLWGEWVNVNDLIQRKLEELPAARVPSPVAGQCDGTQATQAGAAQGHVMARISGASMGGQKRQSGRSIGRISMTAKNERELLELLLLEAA
jgi:hypothetical protein